MENLHTEEKREGNHEIIKWSEHFEMQSSFFCSFCYISFRFIFFFFIILIPIHFDQSHANLANLQFAQPGASDKMDHFVFVFMNSGPQCLYLSYDSYKSKNDFDINECNTNLHLFLTFSIHTHFFSHKKRK